MEFTEAERILQLCLPQQTEQSQGGGLSARPRVPIVFGYQHLSLAQFRLVQNSIFQDKALACFENNTLGVALSRQVGLDHIVLGRKKERLARWPLAIMTFAFRVP